MAILDQIQEDVKAAMKAGEKEKVQALRLVVSELQRALKEGNDDEIGVLQSARKKRLESAKAYREGGREEAAAREEREADLISVYLPAQISDDELAGIVAEAIAQTGATTPGDMGKVMGAIMPRVKGRADGSRVQAAVKERLG